MGVKYEYNWYLVVSKEDDIKEVNNDVYTTTKREPRIYPINSTIPLILKNRGCVGMVRIKQFTISEKETIINFQYEEKFNGSDNIAKHYYSQYLDKKSLESNII